MTEIVQEQVDEEVIDQIITSLPESQWLDAIHKALPNASNFTIISTIEALTGGDVHGVDA